MAEIYLRHPQHGEKVAHNTNEAKHDKENGWEEFVPSPPAPKVPAFLAPDNESDLPADFPGREYLIAAGVLKWADVSAKSEVDLLSLNGIDAATAKAIQDRLDS